MPAALVVVACLFIFGGVSCAIEMIATLARGGLSINLGVVNLFIGLGLLRRNPRSRSWALVFTWIGLVGAVILGLIVLFGPAPDLRLFGRTVGPAPKPLAIIMMLGWALFQLWQYWVLTRPDVQDLFRKVPA
jgi:hypothetical protein